MESVRRAGPEDLEQCVDLVAEARRAAAGQRGGPELLGAGGDGAEVVASWLSAASVAVWLGQLDAVPVGVAAGILEAAPAAVIGRVACCYVQPEARGVGVGTALMAALVAWCGAQGCTGVDATALPGDRSSKQLLEAAGFKTRLLILRRPG